MNTGETGQGKTVTMVDRMVLLVVRASLFLMLMLVSDDRIRVKLSMTLEENRLR